MEWPTYLDEYEKLLIRMSTPRVVVDNAGCSNATILMIDSARKHGILLEAVQVLMDLNLSIKKAYISSDGRWFMYGEKLTRCFWFKLSLRVSVNDYYLCCFVGYTVFHVTDLNGNKLTDQSVLGYIEQSLETVHYGRSNTVEGLTVLELTGMDRVGLLSEVFAVLANLRCNVVDAKVWTHSGRIASLIYVKDDDSGSSIEDPQKLELIKDILRSVLKGDNVILSARISVSLGVRHMERRLHQMMFADRDYERKSTTKTCPVVLVQNYLEKDYSVVNIQCKDRNKVLFDVVCTLTDMQYVVFHATLDTSEDKASLEFFIRHTDGTPISSDAERDRVILCLQAAIERRASQGVSLELCTADRKGLLADVTRTIRENGLNVTRAEILTTMNTALNTFYITDALGNQPDMKTIDSVREKIGLSQLKVKEPPLTRHRNEPTMGHGGALLLSLGGMLMRNLYNLGLIKSYS